MRVGWLLLVAAFSIGMLLAYLMVTHWGQPSSRKHDTIKPQARAPSSRLAAPLATAAG
jgi:hypothetical protein